MICPRCESSVLVELDRQGITIDRCETCRGVWLDRGELEKLIARETQPAAERPRDDREYAAAVPGEPPRRYRRADSDDGDDDDRRHYGKKRSAWWDIFD
jgi:uncharacterized protein